MVSWLFRKSDCVIVTIMAAYEAWQPPLRPSPLQAAPSGSTAYGGWNVCEASYNVSAAMAGPNYLKDSGPFHVGVELRDDVSYFSIYFAGCGRFLRQEQISKIMT
jgi:hypothetical protein